MMNFKYFLLIYTLFPSLILGMSLEGSRDLEVDHSWQIKLEQDTVLEKIWPTLKKSLGIDELLIDSKITRAYGIRSWLNDKNNKSTLEQVVNIDLSDLGITSLPSELSLFVNLRILGLENNKLKSINIPNTLTKLGCLYADNNPLEFICMPNEISTKLEIFDIGLMAIISRSEIDDKDTTIYIG